MKAVNSYILRALCALLVGILLVMRPEEVTTMLVQIIGGLFLLSGVVSVVYYFVIRHSDTDVVKPVFPVVGLGSVLFGLLLAVSPGFFVRWLMLVVGLLMVIAGINQLWNMFRLRKLIPFRWYMLLTTLVIIALGVLAITKPMESASLPTLLLGVNCILYGISELVNGVRWRKYEKMNRHKVQQLEQIEVIVPAEPEE